MSGNIEFELRPRRQPAGRRSDDVPFDVLVLGDFGGVAARGAAESGADLADRPIRIVDIDTFDALWRAFAPRLRLRLFDETVDFAPRQLEDFHPDRLYRTLPLFSSMRRLRAELLDPRSSARAVAEIRSTSEPGAEPGAEPAAQPAPAEDTGSMFERLLGRKAGAVEAGPGDAGQAIDLEGFVRRLCEPHLARESDPLADSCLRSIDLASAELVRQILHHADFQALEAAWRSLHGLVAGLETGAELRIFACDVTWAELAAGLPAAGAELEDSGIHRLAADGFRRAAGGDRPWSLAVGDFAFGTGERDTALLSALGAIAAENGAPFLAGARPEILGCTSLLQTPDARDWTPDPAGDARWRSLRRSAGARFIGLALPRVVLRLPYGAATDPIESFPFEEMPARAHQSYLWGNPAFACARLLAQGFLERGDAMEPGDRLEIEDLPAHTWRAGGESELQPCAEVYWSERSAEAALDRGVMPIVSVRNKDAARLLRCQSIADPPAALAGRWQDR